MVLKISTFWALATLLLIVPIGTAHAQSPSNGGLLNTFAERADASPAGSDSSPEQNAGGLPNSDTTIGNAPSGAMGPGASTTSRAPVRKAVNRSHWRNSWILGAMSWEESLSLSGPTNSQLTSNIYAFTAGWARAYRSPGFEWTTGVRGIYGFADIGAQSSTSTYFQKNVGVWGGTVNSGPMFVTKSSKAGLGLSLMGFYRSAHWQAPTSEYSINKQNLAAVGLSLDARWIFGTWCLEQNIAFLPSLESALWQLQIEL